MQRLLAPARVIFNNRDFTVLLTCNVLVGLAYSFVAPFQSMFGTREVGMSPFVFATFMTVTSLCAIGISTLMARWSDTRWSRKSMLLLGGTAGALGYLGYAWLRDIVLLTIVGSVLLGMLATCWPRARCHRTKCRST